MTTRAAPACGPSTTELKTNIANFMERAERIVAHPLGAAESTFRVTMQLNHKTGDFTAVGFEEPLRPREEWLVLAFDLRPIIFLEDDPVSFNKLTGRIEYEHVPLRGHLKRHRDELKAWKKYVYIAAEPIGTPASEPPTPMLLPNQMLEIAPGGGFQSSVDISKMSTDYEYANAYLNAMGWHSDNDKTQAYQTARPEIQVHYAKCAELRVIASTAHVRNLRQWILDARDDGHDL